MKLKEIKDDGRLKKFEAAVDDIKDIVADHMELIKPSKYIEQIDALLKKNTPDTVEALCKLLHEIDKIAAQNHDSEFEGGRAVNPNDELRISSIVDHAFH